MIFPVSFLSRNTQNSIIVPLWPSYIVQSTGDSLDDDDNEEEKLSEAKRNTSYNEVIDADNPQTPSEVWHSINTQVYFGHFLLHFLVVSL